MVKRLTRLAIAAAASAATLIGVLVLTTGVAATAVSRSGCTAESPAQAGNSAQCEFGASGGSVSYKASKFTTGSSGQIADLGAPCGTPPTSTPAPTPISMDGSGTIQLAHAGDCVDVSVLTGTGKIVASSSTSTCGNRRVLRRCRQRRAPH
jgi:hypothetical protein